MSAGPLDPSTRVVLFVFAGREANMRLQLPYVLDLLKRWPNLEYHVWNLSRDPDDNVYVRGLDGLADRIVVFNDLYEGDNATKQCLSTPDRFVMPCDCVNCRPGNYTAVYLHYANTLEYADTLFVKIDDDIVFLETARFGTFLEQVRENPGYVLSANVINNGVCAAIEPQLAASVQEQLPGLPLSSPDEWCSLFASRDFLMLSHLYFFDHLEELLEQDVVSHALPIGSYFSINVIGLTWPLMRAVVERFREEMETGEWHNDERGINRTFPILVSQGFLASHLYFGAQRVQMTDQDLDGLRSLYEQVTGPYLDAVGRPTAAAAAPQ